MFNEGMKLAENVRLRECIQGTDNDVEPELSKQAWKTLTRSQVDNLRNIAERWQIVRDHFEAAYKGIPLRLVVKCGYRPISWEKSKGRSGKSQHTLGKAIDAFIEIEGEDRTKILNETFDFINKNFSHGGRAIYKKSNFIHLDNRKKYEDWKGD